MPDLVIGVLTLIVLSIVLSLLADEAKFRIRQGACLLALFAARRFPKGHPARQRYESEWPAYVAYICDEEKRHLKALREALELVLVGQKRVAQELDMWSREIAAAPAGAGADQPRISVETLVLVEQYLQAECRKAAENGESELVNDLRRLLATIHRRVAPDGLGDAQAVRRLNEAASAIRAGERFPADHLRKLL